MNQEIFTRQGAKRWRAFADTVAALERGWARPGGRGAVAKRFPEQYRAICRDLALARQRQFDAMVVDQLNGLALRGHQLLYQPQRGSWRQLIDFWARRFPEAVRRELRVIGLATALFYGAGALIAVLILWQPDWIHMVMDPMTAARLEQMYDPTSPHHLLPRGVDTDTAAFGFYIQNNISIGFRTFAGGIFFGIGSLVLLLFNGVFLGAVVGHLVNVGFADQLASFVIAHGSLELTATTFTASSGLILGWSLIAPGGYTRADALRLAARRAIPLVYGATGMLLGAAVIEAYWSSSVLVPPEIKYIVGTLCWAVVVLYFVFAGRRPARG